MSNPNLDSRYAKPADVTAAIAAQAVTDAGQYVTLNASPPTPQQYRQSGDTDWTPAFNRMFAANINEIYVPSSTAVYGISSGLILPIGMSLTLAPGATIQATVTITGAMIQTEKRSTAGQWWRDKVITGGTLDCNGLAATGIAVPYGLNSTISNIVIKEATSHSIVLGDSTAPGASNELKLHGVKVDRSTTGTVPAGSFGIWVRYAYDSSLSQCVVVGADTSFRVDKTDTKLVDCHGWGWAGHLPTTIFDDAGYDNTYIGCCADTPSAYGFRVRQFNHTILGGFVYNNASGSDNVIEGIHYDQTSPISSVTGVQFSGADSTHRIAKDVGGATFPNAGLTVLGNKTTNVVLNYTATDRTNVLATNSWIQPSGGAKMYSGSGAPTINATTGDFFIRTDGGSGTWLYRCTGSTTWTAVV